MRSGIPVRTLFIARVLVADAESSQFFTIVEAITASPAWCLAKKVSLMIYAWFLFGAIWVLHAFSSPACSGIHNLVLGVLVFSAMRAMMAVASLRLLFPQNVIVEEETVEVANGASEEEISALHKFVYNSHDVDEPGTSCAVCLSEYQDGELLRELPCGHQFHCACADTWLLKNKRCPLCVQAIDAAPCNLHKPKAH